MTGPRTPPGSGCVDFGRGGPTGQTAPSPHFSRISCDCERSEAQDGLVRGIRLKATLWHLGSLWRKSPCDMELPERRRLEKKSAGPSTPACLFF